MRDVELRSGGGLISDGLARGWRYTKLSLSSALRIFFWHVLYVTPFFFVFLFCFVLFLLSYALVGAL